MAKQTTTKKKANKKTAAKSGAKSKATSTAKSTVAVKPDTSAAVEAKKPVETTTAKAETKKSSKTPKALLNPSDRLARWYKWTSLILFLEGITITLFGNKAAGSLAMQYPTVDTLASEANGHQILALASRHIADVHISWMVGAFLLAFAVVGAMFIGLYRPYLDSVISRGVNAFRWLSIGVGGGLMVVTIALISGFTSIPLLLSMFVLTLLSGFLALGAETVVANNKGVKTRFAHLLCGTAVIAALVPWVVFGLGVLGKFLWHGYMPAYLYSIYGCQFALFVAFLLAIHFRMKRQGRWADAFYTDRSFVLLTFVAATVLAVQVFIGVLK